MLTQIFSRHMLIISKGEENFYFDIDLNVVVATSDIDGEVLYY